MQSSSWNSSILEEGDRYFANASSQLHGITTADVLNAPVNFTSFYIAIMAS